MSESISISQDACPRFRRISRSHATPRRHLGADAVVVAARKAATAPFEIGKDPVSPFDTQRVEALVKEALVIHAGPAGCRYSGGG